MSDGSFQGHTMRVVTSGVTSQSGDTRPALAERWPDGGNAEMREECDELPRSGGDEDAQRHSLICTTDGCWSRSVSKCGDVRCSSVVVVTKAVRRGRAGIMTVRRGQSGH